MREDCDVRRARWRWAIGILVLAMLALAVTWSVDMPRQDRILQTMITGLVTVLLLFVWAVLFSGFARRRRMRILAAGLAAVIAVISCVEIRGVTGDLVPILRWRWDKGPKAEVAKANSAPIKKTRATFPQFLGPNRNGIITDLRLDTNWVARPPKELWRHAVGAGWTGFVVAEGIAVTQEQRGEEELVTAYEMESGKVVWAHADRARYFTTISGEGPRATPAISGGKVYAFGATGILSCLELASGKLIWTKNLVEEHSTDVPEWGFAGAPLVLEGLVIMNAGGKNGRSLVAHDAATGKFVWGRGDKPPGYSSPTVMELAGVKQVVVFNGRAVAGHDLKDGKVLWEHPWKTSTPHCTMPLQISTNRALVSQGYGYGSELLEVSQTNGAWSVERVWKSNRLKSKFANLILHRGFVYALDDGILACLDPQNGERKWHGERYGHGQMLLVNDVILLMAENGEVLLIEPSPDGEKVVARFRALTTKTWNPPALAGEYLLVRNDQEAACFKLPVRN